MLFTSQFTSRIWDTWLYFHEGTFYLYYLITEEYPGAGFGVATSADGVHWEDHGWALRASEEMKKYLGTGSVWKDPDFDRTARFYCNYSEWRLEGKHFVQHIYFAWSANLIHWHKLGERQEFPIDGLFYRRVEDEARWDCIWTLERSGVGYYGYWTATPHAYPGFGFGESLDGLRWKALEPPRIQWGDIPPFRSIEVGAVRAFDGQVTAMLGDYTPANCGMYTFLASSPSGPFRPASRNFALLRGRARMHAYFTRFLEIPGEVLVNHHSISYGEVSGSASVTYFAPLKKAVWKEGALYLGWWSGNERLKQRQVEPGSSGNGPALAGEIRFDPAQGLLLEGSLDLPGSLRILTGGRSGVLIQVEAGGVTRIGPYEGDFFDPEETIDRALAFPTPARFRLLLRGKMLEFYLDELLIQCYSMVKKPEGRIGGENAHELKEWEWG
jgi:hypothetical protein